MGELRGFLALEMLFQQMTDQTRRGHTFLLFGFEAFGQMAG